eukprot:1717062-Rhodomonas_salina.1
MPPYLPTTADTLSQYHGRYLISVLRRYPISVPAALSTLSDRLSHLLSHPLLVLSQLGYRW